MGYLPSSYGTPMDKIYAFGDGDHGLETLKVSDNAFAMKNGLPSAKLVSYNITEKSNDNDAVALQLMKELYINKL